MKRNKRIVLAFGFALIFLLQGAVTIAPAQSNDLKGKLVTIHKDKKCFGEIFAYLMIEYDIAFGFEESSLDEGTVDFALVPNIPWSDTRFSGYMFGGGKLLFTINVDNGRLDDVLNQIIKQAPNYKWEINDDVVNIVPVNGRDKRYKELLATRISKFSFRKGRPIAFIRNTLIELPEFINTLKATNLNVSKRRSDSNFIDRPMPVEMNFSDLTLRELLNRITKTKRGGWVLKESDVVGNKEKEFVDIQI